MLLAKTDGQSSNQHGLPNGDEKGLKPSRAAGSQADASTKQAASTPSGSSAKGSEGAPAILHVAPSGAKQASAKSSGDSTAPQPPAPPSAATAAEVAPGEAATPFAQLDDGDVESSAAEDSATATVFMMETGTVPSDPAEPTMDSSLEPAGNSAAPGSKPAFELAPVASGQGATATDGNLSLHVAPAESGPLSPSPQAAPPSAHATTVASEWAEARDTVAVRMAHAVQDGVQNVSIDLHPAELGHVGIELTFHAGGVSVQMTVSRQETYESFSRDRAALEQQLAQSGLNLGSGGLDLRFDQKRDQPPAPSETASAAPIRPLQSNAVPPAPMRLRISDSLLNIIA